MYDYARSFLGKNYLWGGDNPIEGLDCSGYVCELLRAFGFIGKHDFTAQSLYNIFSSPDKGFATSPALGCLAFYGKSNKAITHVAMCLDRDFIIESGGGGSSTTSLHKAAKQDAFIRIRPRNHRKDLVAVIEPISS
jgi:cell wall-associated NlpC family hydrolase